MKLLLGTSGFSYDDWRGIFYPRGLRKGDMLPYYAGHFPAVEINATYYRMPDPSTMQAMTEKVPEGFLFCVKAHSDMTHAGRFNPEAFRQFRRAVEPLKQANMLGCVLAQFPWSFRRSPENEAFLETVSAELPDAPVVIEFRTAEWVQPEVFELLRNLGLSFCCVDEPRLRGLVPPVAAVTGPVGYVRFHGRNGRKWWAHDEAYERYDYLYSNRELAEWVPRVRSIVSQAEVTFAFFNNHYQGKAAQNARQMAKLLSVVLPMDDPNRPRMAGPGPTLPGLEPGRDPGS